MFSKFFIERPIFATVLSLLLVLAGLAAMRILPISRYPEISPPVVNVRAIYPGASAEVLETTVAAPIEQSINGIEKMLYQDSTSSGDGVVAINVTFDVGTDLDIAAVGLFPKAYLDGPGAYDSVCWWEQKDGLEFTRHSIERDHCAHAACTAADVNNDGRVDLIVGEWLSEDRSAFRVFLNLPTDHEMP